jgi:hypothetical protein
MPKDYMKQWQAVGRGEGSGEKLGERKIQMLLPAYTWFIAIRTMLPIPGVFFFQV